MKKRVSASDVTSFSLIPALGGTTISGLLAGTGKSLNSSIETNLADVRKRIESAAKRVGREPETITLVAVTKGRAISDARTLYDLGIRHFGENRIPEAESKIAGLPGDIVWHMIGNLQRRKAASAVRLFPRIDSVDRPELAETLNRRAKDAGKILDVLVEVNVSGEGSKHGVEPAALPGMLDFAAKLPHIRVQGLMTMAPLTEDEGEIRNTFSGLRRLSESLQLPVVSMGMTLDFEIAIEEGATEVRIGSALFE